MSELSENANEVQEREGGAQAAAWELVIVESAGVPEGVAVIVAPADLSLLAAEFFRPGSQDADLLASAKLRVATVRMLGPGVSL